MPKGFLDSLWGAEETDDGYRPRMPESAILTNDFSGKWTCSLMYRKWVEEGIDLDNLRLPYASRHTLTAGSGAFYYWKNSQEGYAEAERACQEIGSKYGPNLSWRWEMPMNTILGWQSEKDPVETFGEFRGNDVDIIPMSNRKNRHRYQMIVLPSALQAMAVAEGYLAAPIYDYAASLSALRDKIDAGHDLSDDMVRLIGSEKEYASSELWKVRVALWKALNEENALAYTVGQGRYDFESKTMLDLMRVVYKKTTIWATVSEVPDPHIESVTKAGKHLNIFCISQVYTSREEAVEKRGAEYQGNTDVEVDVPLPERWKAIDGVNAEDWLVSVREIVSKYDLRGKNRDEAKRILTDKSGELANVYYATVDEVVAALQAV